MQYHEKLEKKSELLNHINNKAEKQGLLKT